MHFSLLKASRTLPSQKKLSKQARKELIHALYQHHESLSGRRWSYLRKRYSWLIVVMSTKIFKRSIDIFFSAFFLLLTAPLFIMIGALIKATDRGPIFYTTHRVGRWGKEFYFPKFRSMHIEADQQKKYLKNELGQSITFKIKKDPRVTWIGRILRKFSLDELPQLWSVLKGDMSLVGPRPPLPSEVARYTLEERKRLDITPGLTCTWQISGRSNIPFDEQVELDLEYIRSQNAWVDLKILVKTIPAVFLGRGAY